MSAPGRSPSGFPLIAMMVPALGAVGLWLITGSVVSLWFAALSPLMMAGTAVDRWWMRRRHARREARAQRAQEHEHEALRTAQACEDRSDAWRQLPDIAMFAQKPDETWRSLSARQGRLLIGATDASEGDEPAGMPLTLPLRGVLDVCGSPLAVEGVVRALVVHACLVHAPGELEVAVHGAVDAEWIAQLPHAHQPGRQRLVVAADATSSEHGDITIVPHGRQGATRVTLERIGAQGWAAQIDAGTRPRAVRAHVLSEAQARHLAGRLRERAGATADAPPPSLRELLAVDEAVGVASGTDADVRGGAPARPGTLTVPLGWSKAGAVRVDLVTDGPHALVSGTTGSGKSELLRTWVVALCARYDPDEVEFVLADFKGGTAFDALLPLPHVVGVLTDLDEKEARRGLNSLRAEVRRRERLLASAGVREVDADPSVVGRLVIVVDEFAALVGAHPELVALFADIAARGRALGMHLVLGTQRATGVFRDALLANCPLRVALRAADRADSTLMLGDDTASLLRAGPRAAGTARLRRAVDARSGDLRVAQCDDELVAEIARSARPATGHVPWLPPLPRTLTLSQLDPPAAQVGDRRLSIGRADDPDRQRQYTASISAQARGMCVVGAGGSGVSTALATVQTQHPQRLLRVDASDVEHAWDTLVRAQREGRGVVIDDADDLLARLPPDYAAHAAYLVEALVRAASAQQPVFLGAERLGGVLARVADLLPHRLLLRQRNPADAAAYTMRLPVLGASEPPGRGYLDEHLVQVAWGGSDVAPPATPTAAPPVWRPDGAMAAWVTRPHPRMHTVLEQWQRAGAVVAGVGERDSEAADLVYGDPEQWQRSWAEFTRRRDGCDVLIDPSCAAEYRLFTGSRDLPPYCEAGRSRAWLVRLGVTSRVALER